MSSSYNKSFGTQEKGCFWSKVKGMLMRGMAGLLVLLIGAVVTTDMVHATLSDDGVEYYLPSCTRSKKDDNTYTFSFEVHRKMEGDGGYPKIFEAYRNVAKSDVDDTLPDQTRVRTQCSNFGAMYLDGATNTHQFNAAQAQESIDSVLAFGGWTVTLDETGTSGVTAEYPQYRTGCITTASGVYLRVLKYTSPDAATPVFEAIFTLGEGETAGTICARYGADPNYNTPYTEEEVKTIIQKLKDDSSDMEIKIDEMDTDPDRYYVTCSFHDAGGAEGEITHVLLFKGSDEIYGYSYMSGYITARGLRDCTSWLGLDNDYREGTGDYYALDRHEISKERSDEILAKLKEAKVADETARELGGGSSASVEQTCINSGGAQSLGWILCPALDVVAGAATGLYNDMVEPALRVEPELFTSAGEGTRNGWETFRNIANIIFVIVLLIVIFSQVTGVGIDNYGVKKIIPKLIVMAILINLSYFVCQALVDLSNIFGSSLQALFENIPVGESEGMTFWGGVQSAGSTILITSLLAAVGMTSLWAAVAAGGGVGILIGLVVAALSALISFFFLFVLLAARKTAVVILVVLSPIAIVCYVLPNTKPLFDKYKKILVNLLMVYPIAGVLVGGGNYVSRLLLTVGDKGQFFMMFTAMMAGIIPIFFIPTVLRNAMNMMGSLGAKISGFGQNMGRRFTGNLERGVKGTEAFKNYQNRLGERRQGNFARRERDRLTRRAANGHPLTQGQTDRLAKANEMLLAREKMDQENQFKAGDDFMNAMRAKQGLETGQSQQDMLLYGDGRYLSGLEAKQDLNREQSMRDAMLYNNQQVVDMERQKGRNARIMTAAEADVGIIPMNQQLAIDRATSSRQAQEFRNYSDQFGQLTKPDMETQLTNAVTAFTLDRSDANATRLMAALAVAESKGMDKEMLTTSGLARLGLNANSGADARVLNQLAGSRNKVLSQYAKSRGKHSGLNNSVSLESFVKDMTSTDSLVEAFKQKGSEVLVGMDDDTLGYIGSTNAAALSTEQLVNAASATSDEKELRELNNMLLQRAANPGYSMKTGDLAKLKVSTVTALGGQDELYRDAVAEIKANPNSSASQRILASMDRDVRSLLGL